MFSLICCMTLSHKISITLISSVHMHAFTFVFLSWNDDADVRIDVWWKDDIDKHFQIDKKKKCEGFHFFYQEYLWLSRKFLSKNRSCTLLKSLTAEKKKKKKKNVCRIRDVHALFHAGSSCVVACQLFSWLNFLHFVVDVGFSFSSFNFA